ncbi:hypothetical protein Tco_0169017 [Tanacetum coccineum]
MDNSQDGSYPHARKTYLNKSQGCSNGLKRAPSKVLLPCHANESEYKLRQKLLLEAVLIRKLSQWLGVQERRQTLTKTITYSSAEGVLNWRMKILKVHTDNNLADPFTKALSNRKLTQQCSRGMGLSSCLEFHVRNLSCVLVFG